MEISVINHTDAAIDICCGLDQEFTVGPGEDVAVNVEDGDVLYIDKIYEEVGSDENRPTD